MHEVRISVNSEIACVGDDLHVVGVRERVENVINESAHCHHLVFGSEGPGIVLPSPTILSM